MLVAALGLAATASSEAQVLQVEHAAVASGGAVAANADAFHTNASHGRAMSANGRWYVFRSNATNLVPGPVSPFTQILLRDRLTGTTELISRNGANPGNGFSVNPSVSDDGRYVVFSSSASNLVENDLNGVDDIFVHDRLTGTNYRASVGPQGQEGSAASNHPAISGDGRVVAFTSSAPEFTPAPNGDFPQAYVRVQSQGLTELISRTAAGLPGMGTSRDIALSADGRFVAFGSEATNLTTNPTNAFGDIFVRDRQTGAIEHVSVRTNGTPGGAPSMIPSISADGRLVSFATAAALDPADTNSALDGYVRDRSLGLTQRITLAHDSSQIPAGAFYIVLSGDGHWVTFVSTEAEVVPGVPSGTAHVYLRQLTTGQVRLISTNRNGTLANPTNDFPVLGRNAATVGLRSSASNWIPDVGAPSTRSTVYLNSPNIDEIQAAGFE